MNGVCCRRLLDHIDPIFAEVRDVMSERLKYRDGLTVSQLQLLTQTLKDFVSIFELLDVVFSRVRIIDPTQEEIESTVVRVAVKRLEEDWRKLEMNVTPKCHVLFDHTMNQVENLNGIADLAEDYLERAHQTGKQLDHLVARMNCQCFRQQELVKIRRQWLASDPRVIQQVSNVTASRQRRKAKALPSNKRMITRSKSSVKREAKRLKREMVEVRLCKGN